MVWRGQLRLSLSQSAPRVMPSITSRQARHLLDIRLLAEMSVVSSGHAPGLGAPLSLSLGHSSAAWVTLVRALNPTDSHWESHRRVGGCCLSSQIAWHMMSVLQRIYANQTSRERSEITCFPWAAAILGRVCVNQQEAQNLPDELFLFGSNLSP